MLLSHLQPPGIAGSPVLSSSKLSISPTVLLSSPLLEVYQMSALLHSACTVPTALLRVVYAQDPMVVFEKPRAHW